MRVVLASNNAHKLEELRAILSQLDMQVVSQCEMGITIEPDENGSTFEENSYIKAKTILDACGLPTIADDSGLSVDALAGAPGIHSARYGGDRCTNDRERLMFLLENMKEIPDGARTAKFVCVITLLLPSGEKIVARGECPGEILHAPEGTSGFGYDPVFYIPEKGCTFAQMRPEDKNEISHRARALAALAEQIRKGNGYADK